MENPALSNGTCPAKTILFRIVDTLTIAERSRLMAKIKGKDTAPERMVRSMLHRAGYRFRLRVATLPGRPDIVLPCHRAVVFVHGCFWHRHKGCGKTRTPKSHKRYWVDKFTRNIANDRKHLRQLRFQGWRVVVVWECQLEHPDKVLAHLINSLKASRHSRMLRG